MNIGLIGSGGREHALCQKIFESKLVKKIVCFPGNAGTSSIAKNVDINVLDFNILLKHIKINDIDLVIVGPEEPLVNGLADFLKKNKIKVFGPSKFASKLEGSKIFMKKICKANNIPTAAFKICINKRQVFNFLKKNKLPMVVKADGIAAGKGVAVCKTKKQVTDFSNQIFNGKFKSSKKLIIEEFLNGEEVSYFVVVDKNHFKFFGTAQDHKRVKEGDKGNNTGGMGAYSPAPIITKDLEEKIIKKIVKPTLSDLKKRGKPYTGFLYVGLMIIKNEPFLIEFNVRMGDPECQVILPRLKTDIVKIFLSTINNSVKNLKIKWDRKKSMTIVLCSKGYPESYKKNIIIKGLDKLKLKRNNLIFHAGTKINDDKIFSNGGRVLNFTALGGNFYQIRTSIIKKIKKLNWKYGFFRKDIGWRIINNESHKRKSKG